MSSCRYILMALAGTLCATGTVQADENADHHTNRSVEHGELRPAQLGESPPADPAPLPEHPEHEAPHDAQEAMEHPDVLHHGALDHDTHYHGSFSGYPNYQGRVLDSAQPMVLVTRSKPLTTPVEFHHFGGGVSASLAQGGESVGYSAFLRARGHRWEADFEIARELTSYAPTSFGKAGTSPQVSKTASTRAGGSIYLNLLHHAALKPYLVAGGGIRFPEKGHRGAYAEGGAGLSLSLTPQLSLTGDIRSSYGRYSSAGAERNQSGVSARIFGPAAEQETSGSQSALAFRLAAILYW